MLIKDRIKDGFFPNLSFCSVSTKNDTEMTPQSGGLGGRDRPLLKSRDHLDKTRLETDLKRLL